MGNGPGDGIGVGNEAGPYAQSCFAGGLPRLSRSDVFGRGAKNQTAGAMLLAVMVGADGRVKETCVLRGLGMGLDENAVQTVRSWQFLPAKDAGQHPVGFWIKVETMFRLF
jgi:periplasmic protein TonB